MRCRERFRVGFLLYLLSFVSYRIIIAETPGSTHHMTRQRRQSTDDLAVTTLPNKWPGRKINNFYEYLLVNLIAFLGLGIFWKFTLTLFPYLSQTAI